MIQTNLQYWGPMIDKKPSERIILPKMQINHSLDPNFEPKTRKSVTLFPTVNSKLTHTNTYFSQNISASVNTNTSISSVSASTSNLNYRNRSFS